jgi:actin-like ATPase involved in cell morphogenesis
MPVLRADSPLTCVAFGSGAALAHFDELSRGGGRQARTELLTPDWRTA